ncbi:acylneuraminate cytidylyltransferase family protein [Lacisediminihabitans changchengi]|nr:acylneuraminate cytidylyltransferase family protein [Lacisediminihabitans changchengi]
MSVVAVIPARGGSKGVPGKNLRTVGGVALVARAVASARASRFVDRVIVSTDDPFIGAVATDAGAEVFGRPAALATDHATSESALLHVLDELPTDPDVLVFIQATSPFIDVDALDEAIDRVLNGGEDVVFSAIESHAFLWRLAPGGARGVNHDAAFRQRRQDRTPEYRETGAFYVMRAGGFRQNSFRFFGRVGVALVDERTAIEIDTEDELALADSMAPLLDPVVVRTMSLHDHRNSYEGWTA